MVGGAKREAGGDALLRQRINTVEVLRALHGADQLTLRGLADAAGVSRNTAEDTATTLVAAGVRGHGSPDQLPRMPGQGAFLLDLSQWAIEEPGRWARWVAPCPVGREDTGRRKHKRQLKARIDARTRERLPVLPVLVRTVDQRRRTAETLLRAARETEPGTAFTVDGQALIRPLLRPGTSTGKIWAEEPASGKRRDLVQEEEYAFWAWATVEVLRLTSVRIEELLEISHHSLVQYRLPTTGEILPLLQIAPSKTDAERLLVVSPELAEALSTIISRIRESSGPVPMIPAYDWHECMWMPPAPLPFQRRFRTERRAISHGTIRKMVKAALADTRLVDPADGRPAARPGPCSRWRPDRCRGSGGGPGAGRGRR